MDRLLKNKPLLVLCLLLSSLFLVWLCYGLATRDTWQEEQCVLVGYEVRCEDIRNDAFYITELAFANASECVVRGNTDNLGKWDQWAKGRLTAYVENVYLQLTTKPFACWVRTCNANYSRYKPLDANGILSGVIFGLLILMMIIIMGIYVYLLFFKDPSTSDSPSRTQRSSATPALQLQCKHLN